MRTVRAVQNWWGNRTAGGRFIADRECDVRFHKHRRECPRRALTGVVSAAWGGSARAHRDAPVWGSPVQRAARALMGSHRAHGLLVRGSGQILHGVARTNAYTLPVAIRCTAVDRAPWRPYGPSRGSSGEPISKEPLPTLYSDIP